jgi:chromosome partitioning protein
MAVVAAINLKGGVGKTSGCLHLAGALALLGRKVLCCDNDPQSSLTNGFVGPEVTRQLDPAETIAAIYAGDDPLPGAVIRPTGFTGIDLLAGSRHAASYNVPDPHRAPIAAQLCLREFLDQVRGDYSVILIDCPPTLSLASWAAMGAADAFFVPSQTEDFGAQGVQDVLESADAVRALVNPGLALAGLVLTMYQPRRTVSQLYADMLRRAYGDAVFAATIPESVDYVEAVAARKPVGFHKPRGAAAKAIRAVAEELLVRLETRAEGAGEAA